MEQKSGTSATLSIIAAVGSFIVTFTGHPFFGLLLGIAAIPLGGIGVAMAASPKVGGGLMSVIAIIVGLIAIGVAVLGMIGALVF
ncbi:hypothetical protein [Desulfuromonas sp. TF]|jgi:hypothetical protein|uniref:hypothetical protein n=1 Tax=Desulfuromonas sp. TF TaxID=1232410 RepID=UPI0004020FBF|nr:hypothetical protein [Desulfuromonas sp. TF]